MIKRLTVILFICNCSLIYAQTIKTDVLVIGGSPAGIATAIQSARSKVKTVLAIPDTSFGGFGNTGKITIETNRNIPSGFWGEFRRYMRDSYKNTPGYDTTYNAPLSFEPRRAASILKNLADTTKNLTTYVNAPFTAIKKDGDKWEVGIMQNEKAVKIIARVIVDATENGELVLKAGAQLAAPVDNSKDNSQLKTYRTSIAALEALPGQRYDDAGVPKNNYPPYPAYSIPMRSVLATGANNLLVIEKVPAGSNAIQYLPIQLSLGQGAGTIAAYCAFFKTTTENLKVRIIQGELLDFKANLLPFSDVRQNDRDWRAIQQVCETGLLKGVQQVEGNNAQFIFEPDSLVNTAGVQPVLTEIYTRAFLWFGKEKPGDKFTLGNLLSFISDYTLTDPVVLKARIQKEWKALYKFEPYFDLNRQVTRREFAVLANKFLNPFARTVDLNGRMVN